MEAQPEAKIEYTARLDTARTNSNPRFRLMNGKGRGKGDHKISARERAKIGANVNSKGEEGDGRRNSLIKSFTPSAMG